MSTAGIMAESKAAATKEKDPLSVRPCKVLWRVRVIGRMGTVLKRCLQWGDYAWFVACHVQRSFLRNRGMEKAAVLAYNRARQYQAQQDWESAISYYRRAIENNPGMANAWFNLGLVFAAKSDSVGARDAYEHAIRAQPDMIAARYNLALLLLTAHKRDEALTQLREIVRLQADNAAAFYVLGYVLADDPLATQQAKQAYNKFIELAPNDPNAAGVRDWLKRH